MSNPDSEREGSNWGCAIPLGAILPYFGQDLPGERFCWADGQTPWPAAEWLPKHLHGRPVPDLRKFMFLVGAPDVALVGTAYESGRIDHPVIAGEDTGLKIASDSHATHDQAPMGGGGYNSNGNMPWLDSMKISGQLKIPSLPLNTEESMSPHVRCRFIIRVR